MTVPNLITSLRIILTPIFIIYLLDEKYLPALIVFVLAGVSDAIDGFIARVFDQKSLLGAILDPIADKILLVTAFIVLAVKEFIPPWLTVIVISRDFLILLGMLILFLNKDNFAIKPAFISKITTCLQLVTVLNVLLAEYYSVFHQFSGYLFWSTSLLVVTSFLHYMRQWFRIMGEETDPD